MDLYEHKCVYNIQPNSNSHEPIHIQRHNELCKIIHQNRSLSSETLKKIQKKLFISIFHQTIKKD